MKPLILFDLDGVLFDFVGAAYEIHGKPQPSHLPTKWDFFTDWCDPNGMPMDARKFWAPIEAAGADWWAGLRVIEKGEQLLATLLDLDADLAFCTTIAPVDGCYDGKRRALKRLLQAMDVDSDLWPPLVTTPEKDLLAGPTRLLIDDCPANLDAFLRAGGLLCAYQQPWSTRWIAERLVSATGATKVTGSKSAADPDRFDHFDHCPG